MVNKKILFRFSIVASADVEMTLRLVKNIKAVNNLFFLNFS